MSNAVGSWLRQRILVPALALCFVTVSGPSLADAQQAAVGGIQRVQLEAVIANGAKILRDRISFTVSRLENGVTGSVVATADSSPAEITLPAGQYRVAAAYGDVLVGSDFQVAHQPVRHQVNLNAGRIALRVIPHRGAKPVRGNVDWEIFTYGRDASGKRHLIATAQAPRPELVLPHGYYVVKAKTRDAKVRHTIEVTAGHTYKYTLNLNAGSLRSVALNHQGQLFNADEVIWEVYRGKATGDPITGTTGSSVDFTLREGSYTLVARAGELSGSSEVTVRSGNSRKVNITLR